MTAPPSTTIRPLRRSGEFRAAEALQRDVWGFDEIEIVPLHVLMTAARHGGVVLGAFEGDDLVGFGFGFRGVDADGSPVLCSHLLAVAPRTRGRGLGLALKWAQRDAALAADLARIVWTFDPLEHGNARLNLNRLGGVSDRYVVDLYGELRDELNAGLPTDRIEIVWELASPRVAGRADGRSAHRHDPGPVLNPDGPDGGGRAPADAQTVRLVVPEDAQRLRRSDPDAALAWRMHVREALTDLFGAGYLLVGAGHGEHGAELRLAHRDTAPLEDG
jgi:predicted GNAT superfamily acetyltransferase